jgi:hypothetical protein
MQAKFSNARDMVLAALLLLILALPFLPIPGDGTAQMQVHFRTSQMTDSRAFTTETSRSVCTVMAAALTYEDPHTGEYTHVACSE